MLDTISATNVGSPLFSVCAQVLGGLFSVDFDPINQKPFWVCPQWVGRWGGQRECDGIVEEGGTEGRRREGGDEENHLRPVRSRWNCPGHGRQRGGLGMA